MNAPIRSEVFHGIRSVDPAVWACVSAGHPYTSHDWCVYGEAVLGCEGHYVIQWYRDEPVGGACFSVLHREQLPFKQPAIRATLENHLKDHPLLACRTAPGTNFSGLCLPPDPALRAQSLAGVREATLDIVKASHASFVLFDYLSAADLEMDWQGFTPLKEFLDIGTRLEIVWDDFDGYIESIKEKSLTRRKWLKRNLKKSLESGLEVCFDRTPDIDEAVRLHENVEKQYNEIPFPFTREVFSEAHCLPGAVWMTAHYQGRLVASELLLHDSANRVCTPVLYGRDYQVENVYFYTYYEVVKYVIGCLNARLIVGNSGAYDFKHHLGFEPDPRNNMVFASASPFVQSVGSWISQMVS